MVGIKDMGQWIIAMVSSMLLWLFGAWDIALQVMVGAMCVDYISGLIAAKKEENISSKKGIHGIYKKVGMLLCVVIANLVDMVTGADIVRTAIILFLIGNEGISVLENLGRLGVPIPQKLLDVLIQLKGNGEGDKDEHNKEAN